jgi:hypothetical protein
MCMTSCSGTCSRRRERELRLVPMALPHHSSRSTTVLARSPKVDRARHTHTLFHRTARRLRGGRSPTGSAPDRLTRGRLSGSPDTPPRQESTSVSARARYPGAQPERSRPLDRGATPGRDRRETPAETLRGVAGHEVQRICPVCGAAVSGRPDAVYCGSSCHLRAHRGAKGSTSGAGRVGRRRYFAGTD